jgi:prepilin-type processing-associated H-X9-DG protein
MIRFSCSCGKQLQAREEYAGQRIRCPQCGRDFPIPELEEELATDENVASVSRQTAREDESGAEEPGWDASQGPVRTSGKAIASLILGLMSFLCSIFTGIPAIILGILGLREVGRSHGRVEGQGLAIAGITTGAIGMILVCPMLVGLLVPEVRIIREAANKLKCQNNLHQITMGLMQYHQIYGRFPPAGIRDRTGKPLYSWRVALLPFMGENALHQEFHLDEPWDSQHNRPLLDRMPKVYAEPSETSTSETVYQVFTGPRTAFEDPNGQQLSTFTDGPANTLLVVEAIQPVRWTEPVDLAYPPGNRHGGGFNAAFADGSVHFLRANIDEQVLRALITRNGGEGVQLPQ